MTVLKYVLSEFPKTIFRLLFKKHNNNFILHKSNLFLRYLQENDTVKPALCDLYPW